MGSIVERVISSISIEKQLSLAFNAARECYDDFMSNTQNFTSWFSGVAKETPIIVSLLIAAGAGVNQGLSFIKIIDNGDTSEADWTSNLDDLCMEFSKDAAMNVQFTFAQYMLEVQSVNPHYNEMWRMAIAGEK